MASKRARWHFQTRPLGTDSEWTTSTRHGAIDLVANAAATHLAESAKTGLLVEVRLILVKPKENGQ